MEQISREVRLALRGLAARPGTSLLATASLALGIGLTTAMFCIVDGIFLRGLPFERADRLLYVGEQDTRHAARRPRDAGSLVVRSRRLDVLVLAGLAIALALVAAVTPFPSGRA